MGISPTIEEMFGDKRLVIFLIPHRTFGTLLCLINRATNIYGRKETYT